MLALGPLTSIAACGLNPKGLAKCLDVSPGAAVRLKLHSLAGVAMIQSLRVLHFALANQQPIEIPQQSTQTISKVAREPFAIVVVTLFVIICHYLPLFIIIKVNNDR